jgi:tRNA (guanine-N7-)-methyltransferase
MIFQKLLSSLMQTNKKNHRRLNLTRTLPMQTKYTLALENDFSHRAFSEERAPLNRGFWRQKIFEVPDLECAQKSMDLEIGTGNGFHFTHHALKYPERCLVGLEIKYRPLYLAIKRTLAGGAKNAAICRVHAFNLNDVFAPNEINNIFVHFPDPWTSPNKPKNRVMNRQLLMQLYELQRADSTLEFKTDSREMFLWALEEVKATPYKVLAQTLDLHKSEYAASNFITFFENLFLREQIEINYLLLQK